MKTRKCELCHESEAVYAMQYIGSNIPDLYRLGSHIRGFGITPVCADCGRQTKWAAEQVQAMLQMVEFPGG